ncbi:CHAT domain-containing tetratricopeptide repeat protein [Vannielia litorea]|uniref:CHAT domain-containing tetratricopeptide repeat protein n=1 Tax=Vannielia litorea TaxID=1217970 RepID=UPI001BCCC935|nr:CHAT domain-containing protein [Vannielia litorea]MBS8228998.1 CHAT domain-containing protein [Vannielia litorea]
MIRFLALVLALLLTAPMPSMAQQSAEQAAVDADEQEVFQLYAEGRYEEALPRAEAVQVALEAAYGVFSERALLNHALVANILERLGRQAEGIEISRAVLALWVTHHGRDHPEAQRARMNLAMGLSNARRAGEAMPYALEAYEFARAHWGPEAVTTLLFRSNVAGLLERTGEYEAALAEFRAVAEGLKGVEGMRAARHRASALRHAARMAEGLGHYDDAIMLYAETVPATRAAFGNTHPQLQTLLYEMGRLAGRMGYVDVASEVLLESAKLAEALYGFKARQTNEVNAMIALVLTREGPGSQYYDIGAGLLDTVIANMEEVLGRTHPALSEPLTWAATLAMEQGDWPRALELARWSAEIGTAMSTPWFDALAAAEASGEMSAASAAEEAFEAVQASFLSVASTSTSLLEQRLQLALEGAGEADRAYTDAIRRRNELQAALLAVNALPLEDRVAGDAESLQAELAVTVETIATLQAELAQLDPWLTGLKQGRRASAAEVRESLKPGEAVVVIDVPSGEYGASRIVVVTRESAAWAPIPAAQPEIAALVERVRQGIELKIGVRAALALKAATGEAPPEFDGAAAAELYALTFGQVAPALEGIDHIYVELRGPVGALPPQLLLRSAPEGALAEADWLLRHHAFTVIPSVLSLRIAALAEELGRAPEPFLGVANPDYGAGAGAAASNARTAQLRSGLAPLPETAGEVRAVARAVAAGGDAVIEGAAASEAALKAAPLERFRVLYFATHGLITGDAVEGAVLDESALALTPGAGEDGFLKVSEIVRLKLNADWVVLSACNTAVGGKPGAEALSGLAQGFFYAGARALLVSHWPVESQSAVALMTDIFARRAANPSLSAAEAQRQAMLALMQQDKWSHPAFWAPFILVGDPG